MQSLAVKYRPKQFEDVCEQKSIIHILQDQIKTQTHQNCYLFTGGAGTGKTTCARIFANEINGGKGNAIEIDAASNNGVENVREIIDNSKFKSMDSPYKVYIIDECHMLSTGAWNAMLKLLEEPPAQTIFIMCTTDPQKIPPTILSRVQRYDFQRISHHTIVNRLLYIVVSEEEEISSTGGYQGAYTDTLEPEALEYIAKIADGGMRDAITLLDKCISYSTDLTVENVVAALGTVNYSDMLYLTSCILNREAGNAIITIEEAYRKGTDLKQFMKQYMYLLLDIQKYALLNSFEYLQVPSTYQEQFQQFTVEEYDFMLCLLDSVIKLNNDIKWEQNPKPLIEATILLLCQE